MLERHSAAIKKILKAPASNVKTIRLRMLAELDGAPMRKSLRGKQMRRPSGLDLHSVS